MGTTCGDDVRNKWLRKSHHLFVSFNTTTVGILNVFKVMRYATQCISNFCIKHEVKEKNRCSSFGQTDHSQVPLQQERFGQMRFFIHILFSTY